MLNITPHFAPLHNLLVSRELNLAASFQTSGSRVPQPATWVFPNLMLPYPQLELQLVRGLRLVPFFPFTSLRVFGRAGGLGGLYGHHVCVLSFLWLPRVLCRSSWRPELTGVCS